MAIGEIKIGIAGSGSSFATSPIQPIVLYRGDAGAPFVQRSVLAALAPGEPTLYGTTPLIKTPYPQRFSWTFAAWVTKNEARQLLGLSLWQDENKTPLRLQDEVDTILIKAGYNDAGRSLLAGATTPSWGTGYSEGYGIFSVALVFDGEWDQWVGIWAEDESQARQVTFAAVEV
jgi:hypothetical protein